MGIMKMIEDLRIENMARLRDEVGSVTLLAARLERSESQVSQWLNASINSGTGKPRSMKTVTARRIEKACDKHPGWLDQDHSGETQKNVHTFTNRRHDDHPAIAEVVRLMLEMSDDGKLVLLGNAQAVAKQWPKANPAASSQ